MRAGAGSHPRPRWNQGRGLRGGGLEWSVETREEGAQWSKAGRVFQAEGTAWMKARPVCNYCFSDEQPQGGPGQELHFMCRIIYAFGVHTAILSGVMTVITLSPLPKAWGHTGDLCLRGHAVSISEGGYLHADCRGLGRCSPQKACEKVFGRIRRPTSCEPVLHA